MASGFIDRLLVWLGLEPEEAAAGREAAGEADASPAVRGAPAERAGGWRRSRVVPLTPAHTAPAREPTPSSATGVPSMQVIVCQPRTLDEVEGIASHLKARRPVLVSLKQADRDTARRVVDFLSGTVYALDGTMRPVGDDVVLCAPGGVDVKAEGLGAE